MALKILYRLYAKRLEHQLKHAALPQHVGVILDGNRRWAKQMGTVSSQGHQAGANRISQFLNWAEECHIEVVTLWMLSTDNLKRSGSELDELFEIICKTVEDLDQSKRWNLNLLGRLNILPQQVQQRLQEAAKPHPQAAMTVNIAVGYGGREEIVDAAKELLLQRAETGMTTVEIANSLCVEDFTSHLYTAGQPDPDLVIRTSGEQRLSGFLLWQSAHSEYYFCETYWPDFRKIDFLRALRDYSQRERRIGK